MLVGGAECAGYERDFTGRYGGPARLVVRPGDTGEVAAVLRVCREAGVAVVPQGGNTGLVGGSVPGPGGGEVVLSLRRLGGIGPIDGAARQVTVGAGVPLAELQRHVRAYGWEFGVDLAARDSATLGGMAATNAGGERVVKYGTTRANVVGVEAVMADGSVLDRLAGLPKDNTGYDLTGLLVGSEGTLGVITRLRLRLVPHQPRRTTALLALDSFEAALAVLAQLRLLESLELAEFFTADGLALVRERTGLPAPFRRPYPLYLLVECAGRRDPAGELAEVLEGAEGVRDVAVALSGADARRLAAYRERHTEAINAAGIPLKFDVTVPPGELAGFVEALPGLLAGRARPYVFGHLAEGNLHVNLLEVAPADEDAVTGAVLGRVAAVGGSISAEHGVGRAKARYLHLTRSAADIAVMRAVKEALDPTGLFNPGTLLPPLPPAGPPGVRHQHNGPGHDAHGSGGESGMVDGQAAREDAGTAAREDAGTAAGGAAEAGVVLRVAGTEDLDIAAELFRGYLDFYGVDIEQDPDRPRAFLAERLEDGGSLILLAEVPGAGTVGFAQVYRTFSSLSMRAAWVLGDLYVAPAGRRSGAARTLLREVLRRAAEAGAAGVQLETAYDNHVAQGLYEAEGFVREEFHLYFHDLG
ncbi:GNAT family N-acetyltransferase [Streptomyces sp. NPDC091268]|uniref:GNAT family N-acetyltransferase n=1 Tax=Streptomyces sp. NPDC091268 TaxID=3365979 RepID=UPI003828323F